MYLMNRTDKELIYLTVVLVAVIVVGTLMFSFLEGWDLFESFYFTVCLSFSVGFGEIVPSPENRVIAAFFMIVAATIALALAANVAIWFLSYVQSKRAVRALSAGLRDLDRDLTEMGYDTAELRDDLRTIVDETADSIGSLEVKRPDFRIR